MIRRALPAILLSALAGCGFSARLSPAPVGNAQGDWQRLVAANPPRMQMTEQNTGTRRADRKATLLQGGGRDGVIWFRSADNVTLSFRNGILIETRGLGDDMMSTDTGRAEALITAGRSGQITRIMRRLDGSDRTTISAAVCDIVPGGETAINLPAGRIMTREMTETCHNPERSFTNKYWIANGKVLVSRQWISPGVGDAAFLHPAS